MTMSKKLVTPTGKCDVDIEPVGGGERRYLDLCIELEIECLAWGHQLTVREIAALLEIELEEVRAVIRKNSYLLWAYLGDLNE